MGGFQGKVGYSSNINGQDNIPVQDAGFVATPQNVAAYSLAGSYENGGLKMGIAYAAYRPESVAPWSCSPDLRVQVGDTELSMSVDYVAPVLVALTALAGAALGDGQVGR